MSASLRLWVSPRRTRRAQRRLVGLNHAARDRTGGPLRDLCALRVTNLFLQEDREDREAPGMLILRHVCFPSSFRFHRRERGERREHSVVKITQPTDEQVGPLRDLCGLRVTHLFLQEERNDREAPGMLILRHSCFPSTLGFTAEDAEGAEKTCWIKSRSPRPNRSARFATFAVFV